MVPAPPRSSQRVRPTASTALTNATAPVVAKESANVDSSAAAEAESTSEVVVNTTGVENNDWEDHLHLGLMALLRLLVIILIALVIYSKEYRKAGILLLSIAFVVGAVRRLFEYLTK